MAEFACVRQQQHHDAAQTANALKFLAVDNNPLPVPAKPRRLPAPALARCQGCGCAAEPSLTMMRVCMALSLHGQPSVG